MRRSCFLLAMVLTVTSVIALAQNHSKVNCDAQFKFSKAKLDITAKATANISGSVGITPQTVPLNDWTTVILDNQRALCDAYKRSTEAQFSTADYLTKLQEQEAWELDFIKLVVTTQDLNAAKTGGKGGSDTISDLTNTVKNQITALTSVKKIDPANIK